MFNFKIKLIVAAFAFLGIAAFIGCQKNESTAKPPVNDEVNLELFNYIGYWHNVAVKSVYKKLSAKGNVNYKTIREEMIGALNSIDPNTFDLTAMHQDAITSDSILSSEINRVINDSVLIVNSETFLLTFDYLQSNQYISIDLYNALVNLNDMVDNSVANEDFLYEVHQLSNQRWSSSDQVYVNTLIQVVDASYDFWVTNGGYNGKACTLCIIWADAAGAAYGLLIGPVGSIIEGAVFSTIAYINNPES